MKPPHLLKRLAIRVGIFGHKSTCMCILKKTYTNTNILILIIFGFNDRFEKEQLVPLYNNTLTVHIHTVPAFVYHCYVSRPAIKQGCKQKLCRCFFLPKKQTCRHFCHHTKKLQAGLLLQLHAKAWQQQRARTVGQVLVYREGLEHLHARQRL